ncbi:MAG: heavy metal-associated domain-containing protein [Bacteroidota bacterium]
MKQLMILLTVIFAAALFATEKDKTATLNISGMTCQSCANTVEKALKKVDGVKSATVNLAEKKATVVFVSTKTTIASLIKAVDDAGFTASNEKATQKTEVKKKKADGDDCGSGCCGDEAKTK